MLKVTANGRECYNCREFLPVDAFWANKHYKYWRCKKCERERLAQYWKTLDVMKCLACKLTVIEEEIGKMKLNLQKGLKVEYVMFTCLRCKRVSKFNKRAGKKATSFLNNRGMLKCQFCEEWACKKANHKCGDSNNS